MPAQLQSTTSVEMNTSDVESIDAQLTFATQQLKEHHGIIDSAPSSVSHNTTPMNDQDEHSATPSTDGHYMTLQRATTENPENQNTRPKVRDQWPYKQRPDVLIGEVFFNFHTHQYNLNITVEKQSPHLQSYIMQNRTNAFICQYANSGKPSPWTQSQVKHNVSCGQWDLYICQM